MTGEKIAPVRDGCAMAQCGDRAAAKHYSPFLPGGVCLCVIDFYLTLDGLIHRFNYIMCYPINTALVILHSAWVPD